MAASYPIIANCNYESADDTTIHQIRLAVESGLTNDADLVEAMDHLEETLSEHADDDGEIDAECIDTSQLDIAGVSDHSMRQAIMSRL